MNADRGLAQLRCAVYTRVSTDEGLSQEFNSLDAQREACSAFIVSQRHERWIESSRRYDDGGFTGANVDRPALQSLLWDIDAGLVDVVVVYKVDRLSRSLADFVKMMDRFDAKKVAFVAITQQLNTASSVGRLTLNVLLSFAQFEREMISDRIKDKISASKKRGMWLGGKAPLGYDVIGKQLVVNGAEAIFVNQLYRSYLRLGSVPKLVKELRAAGERTKIVTGRNGIAHGGTPYCGSNLYVILARRLYLGEVPHRKLHYKGKHQAILDERLWTEVQIAIEANRTKPKADVNVRAKAYLAGMIHMEDGRPLHMSVCKNGAGSYRYYVTKSSKAEPGIRLAAGVFEDSFDRALISFSKDARSALNNCYEGESKGSVEKAARALNAFGQRWQSMLYSNKRAVIEAAIEGISIGAKQVEISVGVSKLLRHLEIVSPTARGIREHTARLTHASRLKAHGRERRLVVSDGVIPEWSLNENASLLRAIARARLWYEKLTRSDAGSISALAKASGVSSAYASKFIRLAFLAPDLIEAIIDGRYSPNLSLKHLLVIAKEDWHEQRKLFSSC